MNTSNPIIARQVVLEAYDFIGRILVVVEVMVALDNLDDAKKYLFPLIEYPETLLPKPEQKAEANRLFVAIYQREAELKKERVRLGVSNGEAIR